MKKLIATIAIVGLWGLVSGTAFAASINETVGVSIPVNEIFTLSVVDKVDSDLTLAFPSTASGDSQVGELRVDCGTNRNKNYTLQIKATTLTGGTQGLTIPFANDPIVGNTYQFWSVSEGDPEAGNGTDVPATLLAVTDQLAYTSGLGEENDPWVVLFIGISVSIPFGTTADTYASTITVTMVET